MEHLEGVALRAEEFADEFGSGEWGYALGLLHDLGKARPEWQAYLRAKSGYDADGVRPDLEAEQVNHAGAVAKLLIQQCDSPISRVLGYILASHHTGLLNGRATQAHIFEADTDGIPAEYQRRLEPTLPWAKPWDVQPDLDLSLWMRMLFSCLVDADWLDTESYMHPDRVEPRVDYVSFLELRKRFDYFMYRMNVDLVPSEVNDSRKTVLYDCLSTSQRKPGIYSLTVPTGGGKTLAGMGFALNHALKHKKRRIIDVSPYISIIEQKGDVYRAAFGEDQIVEHHSSYDEEKVAITEAVVDGSLKQKFRLATENWDAPIIVTTAVQFWESLFSSKPFKCRKIHNIANSVVILDEAQLMPLELLYPIWETMKLLVDHYGVTFLISTATQPVLDVLDR
jgi:CRISPR-associated endonuclease/helicase Cas3